MFAKRLDRRGCCHLASGKLKEAVRKAAQLDQRTLSSLIERLLTEHCQKVGTLKRQPRADHSRSRVARNAAAAAIAASRVASGTRSTPRLGILRCIRQALATEAVAECICCCGVGKAESNIDLLDLASTPAAADRDASFTVKCINL
jgi:hypothetical protein